MRASSRSIWLLLLFFCATWQCCVLAQDKNELATLLLEKGSSKNFSIALVAPNQNEIYFNANLSNCKERPVVKIKYSYSGDCGMVMKWAPEKFYTIKDGVNSPNLTEKDLVDFDVCIKDSNATFIAVSDDRVKWSNTACEVKNKNFTDGTEGYSLNFTAWGMDFTKDTEGLECDVKLTFHSGYRIYVPPPPTMETTTTVASTESTNIREGGISGATIGFISAGVIISISVIAAIVCYLCWKKGKCNKKERSGSSPVPPSSYRGSSYKGSSRPTVTRTPDNKKPAPTAKVISVQKKPNVDVEFRKKDTMNTAQRAEEEKRREEKKKFDVDSHRYEPVGGFLEAVDPPKRI